jgi:hypothetical protein
MNELLQVAVQAHGGLERRKELKAVGNHNDPRCDLARER